MATFWTSHPSSVPAVSLSSPSFIDPLVLFVKDDANDSKVLGEQQYSHNGGSSASVRRSADGIHVRTRTTMAILQSRGTSRVPQLRSRHCPDQPQQPTPGVSKEVIGAWSHSWSLFFLLVSCSHLAETRPHSPTMVAYQPITHTSIIRSTHTIYSEAGRTPTCAYRLLSLPAVLCGYNIALFSLLFEIFRFP